jgi:hypothetical protein
MRKILNISAITLSIAITAIVFITYIKLEVFYYSDFGSGCSSGGHGFYLTLTSKIIGYVLFVLLYSIFIISLWHKFNISRLWSIPAMLAIIIITYGNGFMLFSNGPCGFMIHKRTAYIFETPLADIFRSDLYNINDKKHAIDGKILGFYLNESTLNLYRINAEPIRLKTSFLLWHLNEKDIEDYFNMFDGIIVNKLNNSTIEIVGGKDMPIEAFLNKITNIPNLYERKIYNDKNGTTRLILKLK